MPGGNKNVICNFTNHLSILLYDLLSMFLGLHISPTPPPPPPITCLKCVNRKPGENHPSSFSAVSTIGNLWLQPAWSKICLRFVCSAEYSAGQILGRTISRIFGCRSFGENLSISILLILPLSYGNPSFVKFRKNSGFRSYLCTK